MYNFHSDKILKNKTAAHWVLGICLLFNYFIPYIGISSLNLKGTYHTHIDQDHTSKHSRHTEHKHEHKHSPDEKAHSHDHQHNSQINTVDAKIVTHPVDVQLIPMSKKVKFMSLFKNHCREGHLQSIFRPPIS